ncbi:hypothetical protein F2Q70_00043259 [Brassica cretica]|uniref:Uncharacterized protein n=1 Tax=Brassica cretica TaxID=69181 RepID=A0A8S9KLP1_BRACR|nr:hypothetical protein F2Q70_00043259 [Brassica cretica]
MRFTIFHFNPVEVRFGSLLHCCSNRFLGESIFSFVCRVSCSKCSRASRCYVVLQGFSLNPAFEKHFSLPMDVRSQNWCLCWDLICDRGVRTEGSRKFIPGKRETKPKSLDPEPVQSQFRGYLLLGSARIYPREVKRRSQRSTMIVNRICQSSDVSAYFTGRVSALISTFGEISLESLMEFYQGSSRLWLIDEF